MENDNEFNNNLNIKYLDNERLFSDFVLCFGKSPQLKDTVDVIYDEGVCYLKFKMLAGFDFVKQAFSTRLGGVSEGIYSSMNLSFGLNDSKENVSTNFKIIGDKLNIKPEDMVYSKQTHTNHVIVVDNSYKGLGVTKPHIYDNVDGLVTNTSNLCLVTAYADCIPVIVLDPINKVIGAAHAGWKGTVTNIVHSMIELMANTYGTNPKDIRACVGPGICADCYEVSEDVYKAFASYYRPCFNDLLIKRGKQEGKWQLNLPMANVFNLMSAGVLTENIAVADICTCCNPHILHSHRATNGERGIQCNFITLI